MNLLVFDGGNQNTLAIVRHLGKHNPGIKIHCIRQNNFSLAAWSKFVYKSHLLPSLKKNEAAFFEGVRKIIAAHSIEYLIPVGSASFSFCIRNREFLEKHVKMMLPPAESFFIAESKVKTYELAELLNVPYPKTTRINTLSELKYKKLSYPAVVKAAHEMGVNVVEYAGNAAELEQIFLDMCNKYKFEAPDLPVIQEYVGGSGFGFFAFYVKGVCKSYFMHKRIREYPVTGGASTCAVSVEEDKLKELGMRLLDHLQWNGVAMVEFKQDLVSGEYKLMEINPKFWGSLELAIVSGINFPQYVLNTLTGKEEGAYPVNYRAVVFQWVINGEWLHFFKRPLSFFKIMKYCFVSKKDIWWSDLLPNLLQFFLIPVRLFKK